MDRKSDIIRKRYNRSVIFFELTEMMMEKGKMGEWRKMVWDQAKGKVLEVGVGTGKNMQFYRDDLDVTAIDFSERMLEKARERAKTLGAKVNLLQMDAQAMNFPDDTFDTVIATCVFCSVPDPVKGLREIRRVCKANGNIILLEHVLSKRRILRLLMNLMNPLVVRTVGANINRDTLKNLHVAGVTVTTEENLMMDIVKYLKCTK